MNRTAQETALRDALSKPYIILLALVVLVSANSLKNSFLSYDDTYFIVDNPNMEISLREIPSLFAKPFGESSTSHEHQIHSLYYRPMLELLYIFNYAIWGNNPVGFHLTNIMFHLLNAFFVYRLGLLLFSNGKSISLIAAALFAVHPVNNEPLGRVAMNENMYGFFMITSIYCFMRDKKFLSWFTFSLALLSKESAVMLPFALYILSIDKHGTRKGFISMRPYGLIIVMYLVVRQSIVGPFWGLDVPQPLFPRILTMAAASLDYVRLLILPYSLHVFYPARLYTSLLEPKVLAAMVALILFLCLALKLKRDKAMLFLLSSPIILLVPAIVKVNALPVGIDLGYIAERLLYVPAMIFSLFISAFVFNCIGTRTKRSYRSAGFAAVIITFAVVTALSCGKWENDTAFYAKLAEDAPDSAVAHYRRGTVLYDQGKFNDAYEEFKAAFLPNPSFSKNANRKSDSSEGKFLTKNNKPFDLSALQEYQPAFAEIHFSLGRVLLAQGDFDRAIRKFKVALVLQPHLTKTHYYLSQAYLKKGQLNKARTEFRIFLKRRETDGNTSFF